MKLLFLWLFLIVLFLSSGCSTGGGLTKEQAREVKIDSTFDQYEAQGLDLRERQRFVFTFSDRARIPVMEMAKALEKENYLVSEPFEEGRKWKITASENKQYSRQTMAEREKSFRWMMYKYKVDRYEGFVVYKADIDISQIGNDQFVSFIKSLDNDALFNVGMQVDRNKEHLKALTVFQELIGRDFKQDTVLFKMGEALVATHEYVEGIEHWEKAIAINPDYLEAHIKAGLIFYENSHWKKAHHHFKEATRIRPDNDIILYHLAKSLIKLERYNEAYTTIQRAVRINPENDHAKGVLKSLRSPAMRKLRKNNPGK